MQNGPVAALKKSRSYIGTESGNKLRDRSAAAAPFPIAQKNRSILRDQSGALFSSCKVLGRDRTKKFHVKHFWNYSNLQMPVWHVGFRRLPGAI
jgi:hypothetical protein